MSYKGVQLRLFFTCWLIFTLHFATNIVREHYPAFALAERGTLRVDEYLGLHPDIFVSPTGGAYINNNPGASIIAAVPLLIFRPVISLVEKYNKEMLRKSGGRPSAVYNEHRPLRREFYQRVRERGLDLKFGIAALVTTAFCMAPLSALSALVMFRLLCGLGLAVGTALPLALLYAFGTPVFFRTGHLNHNLMVAHFALFAFALLFRLRWNDGPQNVVRSACAAGFLAGLAVLCDYSGLVALLLLGGYCLFGRRPWGERWRGALWFSLGAALPILLLFAYQWRAFGNPIYPAQTYMPPTQYSRAGFHGFAWPAPDLIRNNLFDLRFGLFAFCPMLVLGLVGAVWALRGRGLLPRPEGLLALLCFLGFLLFCSANQYARLQWNTGVRMMLPVVPFLFLLTSDVLLRMPRLAAYFIGVIALAQSWAVSMVRESLPESLSRAFLQGPQLPWATVLGKMSTQYAPFLERGVSPLLIFAVSAALLYGVWRLEAPGASLLQDGRNRRRGFEAGSGAEASLAARLRAMR